MTDDELEALAALARDATPGPWYFDGWDIFSVAFQGGGHRLLVPLPRTFHESQKVPDADARYIAAVDPATVLALVDELRTLRDAVYSSAPPPERPPA